MSPVHSSRQTPRASISSPNISKSINSGSNETMNELDNPLNSPFKPNKEISRTPPNSPALFCHKNTPPSVSDNLQDSQSTETNKEAVSVDHKGDDSTLSSDCFDEKMTAVTLLMHDIQLFQQNKQSVLDGTQRKGLSIENLFHSLKELQAAQKRSEFISQTFKEHNGFQGMSWNDVIEAIQTQHGFGKGDTLTSLKLSDVQNAYLKKAKRQTEPNIQMDDSF